MQTIDDMSEDGIVARRQVCERCCTMTARWWFPFTNHISVLVEISLVQQFQAFFLKNRFSMKLCVGWILLWVGDAFFIVKEGSISYE